MSLVFQILLTIGDTATLQTLHFARDTMYEMAFKHIDIPECSLSSMRLIKEMI